MDERDETTGLGASDQADGATNEPKPDPTEATDVPSAEPTGEESSD